MQKNSFLKSFTLLLLLLCSFVFCSCHQAPPLPPVKAAITQAPVKQELSKAQTRKAPPKPAPTKQTQDTIKTPPLTTAATAKLPETKLPPAQLTIAPPPAAIETTQQLAIPMATLQPTAQPVVDVPAPEKELGITGRMQIYFNSRQAVQGDDIYSVDLTCADRLQIKGTISRSATETAHGILRKKEHGQLLEYALTLLSKDSAGATQQVGEIKGSVTVSETGRYDLSKLKLIPAAGFQGGSFSGAIIGKGAKEHGFIQATYERIFGGKKVALTLAQVDPLRFESLSLPSGPLREHSAAQAYGTLDYDYDTGNWLAGGLTLRGSPSDTISGSIKWNPDSARDRNGKGKYEFNLRFNEARFAHVDDEGAFFETATDEEAFFAVEESLPTLHGEIRYRDYFDGAEEPTVVKSDITYHLAGSQLTEEQLIRFLKLWLLIVGPVNDE
jgi:hypothetical protein